jgi:plastocyanin
MRRWLAIVPPFVVLFALPLACARSESTSTAALGPSPVSASAVPQNGTAAITVSPASAALPDRLVTIHDACDPTTFNAVIGPGTCSRPGGIQFQMFVDLLTKHGSIGAWAFSPPNTSAAVGQTFVATNRGGETHTFTHVTNFGGGIVPFLNNLTGNTTVAPECTALEADDFIPPDGKYTAEPLANTGTAKFQCCIHPWMRLEATVTSR